MKNLDTSAMKLKANLRTVQQSYKDNVETAKSTRELMQKILDTVNNHDVILFEDIEELTGLKKIAGKFKGKFTSKKNKELLVTFLNKEIAELNEYIKFNEFSIIIIQQLINSYEVDKSIAPVKDIILLFNILAGATFNNIFSIEDASRCLGMSVYYNANAKNKANLGIKDLDLSESLAKFYNQDGTFNMDIFVEDALNYAKILDDSRLYYFTNKINDEDNDHDFMATFIENLKAYYISEVNNYMENGNDETKKVTKVVATSNISREDIELLNKYYKNGEIISVPENLQEFVDLLNRCEISDDEQRFILNLLAKKSPDQIDVIVENLTGNDLKTYLDAKNILNSLRFTHEDYYEYVSLVQELTEVCEIKSNATDNEELEYYLEEQNAVISKISNINKKHIGENTLSSNNLIFLRDNNDVTFAISDIDNMDSSVKKYVASLLEKLKKDNQGNFRKVLATSYGEFAPLEIVNSKVHIVFVELEPGIYVVIGIAGKDKDYNVMLNRVNNYSMELRNLQQFIKNAKDKNKLLLQSETEKEAIVNACLSKNKLRTLK